MLRTSVVVIGAGQAGLAVSHLLCAASVDHVVLERARVAESWQSQRWDSLRLLTPNWMTRLPGWSYQGGDPDGFMTAGSVAEYLDAYAESFGAPVISGAEVRSVVYRHGRYVVVSDAGSWQADAVVIATGYSNSIEAPVMARHLAPSIVQLTASRYRNPADIPDGAVLVVGASATGVQLADELRAAGHPVVLAVGRHTRVPRRYRGIDIMSWFDRMGILDRPVDRGRADPRAEVSLQIVGSTDHRAVDLPSLSQRGVELVGRVTGLSGATVTLSDDLRTTIRAADAALGRLLARIDEFAAATHAGSSSRYRRAAMMAPASVVTDRPGPTDLDLRARGINAVLWATGYTPQYPWLGVSVLDVTGHLLHVGGQTAAPGLVVVGQRWQTRRSSTLLDGVRHDATLIVGHVLRDVLRVAPRTAGCRERRRGVIVVPG